MTEITDIFFDLDHTLWDFDTDLVEEYSQLISRLPIEYIEIGYRSIDKDSYYGEFFYTPLKI